MNNKEVPVLLLTGYLGSGKTTLLNRILTNEKGYKFAVIVNDIGEVNIDAHLIQQGGLVNEEDDSLVALQNGCICCTLKMDLVQQLSDIVAMNKFDYVVIEASGICEPLPIAQTISSMPTMAPEYIKGGVPTLDAIVTVVDALRMRDEFDSGNELIKKDIDEEDIRSLVIQQIEFCNIVLLNKASMVSSYDLSKIKNIIKSLQPKAEIITCDYGDVDFEKILGTGMFDFENVATSATWINILEQSYQESEDDDDEHEHHHDHNSHGHEHSHEHHHNHDEGEVEEYGINTFVYYNRKPLDINKFDNFIDRLWPKSVIRAKGLCYFIGEEDICYLFEQAGKQFNLKNCGQWYATMPKDELEKFLIRNPQLQKDWDEKYGDRMQKIVFIGQNLEIDYIKQELDKCLVV